MQPPHARLVPLLLAAAVTAQRTFVVDASNGPGTDFTDLPPALAQAQHGDVFLIRAGSYRGAATDKGVSLLGDGTVQVVSPFSPALRVSGLPAGRTFAAEGLELSGLLSTPLVIDACAGRIHVARLRVRAGSELAVQIDACREVTVSHSDFDGLSVAGSLLAMSSSTSVGPQPAPSRGSNPGIRATGSRLLLADCILRGNDGVSSGQTQLPPGPALAATGGEVDIAASAAGASTLTGGGCRTASCFPPSASAVVLSDAILRHGPGVRFVTASGAPAITLFGSAREQQLPLPALVTAGGTGGAPLAVTLASTPHAAFALALGLPADPVALPIGTLCIDVSVLVVLAAGQQGPTGRTTVSVPVPGDPALVGRAFAVQAVAQATPGQLLLTNPACTIVD